MSCTILPIFLSKLEEAALVSAFLLATELCPQEDFCCFNSSVIKATDFCGEDQSLVSK